MSLFSRLFRRQRREQEHREELQFHLDEYTRDLIMDGVDPRDARRAARAELERLAGRPEPTTERMVLRWLTDTVLDVRLAFRRMRRSPGFSAAAILTIGVGVGANVAVFNVVDALLLRNLPVDRPDELYTLQRVGIDDDTYRFSYPTFQNFKQSLEDAGDLTAMSSLIRMYALTDDGPEGVLAELVDGGWFSLLGVGTAYGRPIAPSDDEGIGAHPVAVLSHEFWSRRFGGDPTIVGTTLRVNGVLLNIIGIAEPGFFGLTVGRDVDMWAPLTMQHALQYRGNARTLDAEPEDPWLPQRGVEWLTLVGRIPRAAQRAQFQAGADQLYHVELDELYATQDSTERAFLMRERVVLSSLARGMSPLRDRFADPLIVLMASVAAVLVIACANLAGLLVARGSALTHEHAVQLSLGARPGRLARQAMTESIVLALVGGAVSLIIAHWGGGMLLRAASSGTSAVPLDLSFNIKILAFALGASILTGVGFGIAPAIRVARTDLHAHFKAGARVVGAHGRRVMSLGRFLVVSQLALSLVLATAAGLFARTLYNLLSVDPGYEREQVVLVRLDVRAGGFSAEQLPALYQRLQESVRAVPGVSSVSLSLTGLAFGSQRISGFQVPGDDRPPEWDNTAQENTVSPEFFSTVGLPILRGRGLESADARDELENVVVSEAMALHFFGRLDVIGRQLGFDPSPRFEIVGVVGDARVNTLRETPPRMVYTVLGTDTREYASSLEARVSGSPDAATEAIRRAINTVDPNLPVREVTPIGELLTRGLQTEKFVSELAGLFGVLALVLAAIGLYGITSYSVSRRTNEMGVRIALGAAPDSVRNLVLKDTLVTVTIGVVLGVILLIPVLRLIGNLMYGLSPHDPVTLSGAAGVLIIVGLVAAAIPAWRAARVDPIRALRAD